MFRLHTMIRQRRPALRALPAAAIAALLAGCGPTIGAPPGERVADPDAAVTALQAAAPEGPVHARYAWELDEAGSRLRGQGVVRAIPGERARVDLFGPRGETYLSAALVDGEYRFAGGAAPQVQLPPPAFLWAAFGVFDPPARPLEAAVENGRLTLRYQEEGQETLEFTADGWEADPRLVRARRGGPRGVMESVDVTWTEDGAHPLTARYRDWREYRTLTLTLEEWNVVDGFDPAIFLGGGR
jgi:hypothetical protein